MQFTRDELMGLWVVFDRMKSEKMHFKMAYAIKKNKDKIRSEVESIQAAMAPSSEYQMYDSRRIELCRKYAVQGADGQPVLDGNNRFVIKPEEEEDFNKQATELQAQCADTIAEHRKKQQEFLEFLQEKVEFDFYCVAGEYFPERISPEELDLLSCMLLDPDTK